MFNKEITNVREAKNFIDLLVKLELSFHLDDDPTHIPSLVENQETHGYKVEDIAKRREELFNIPWEKDGVNLWGLFGDVYGYELHMMKSEQEQKQIEALAKHLDLEDYGDIEQSTYDNDIYICHDVEYCVLHEDATRERFADYINETLWAFRPEFLAEHSSFTPKQIEKLQELYEDANDILATSIEDISALYEDAESSDGFGHFLSPYDGVTNEVTLDGSDHIYYIFRQ
jgi:hypothetical protein